MVTPGSSGMNNYMSVNETNSVKKIKKQEHAHLHKEPEGIFNDGWYGSRSLKNTERFNPRSESKSEQASSDNHYAECTQRIYELYPNFADDELSPLNRFVPEDLIHTALTTIDANPTNTSSYSTPKFSIITPFFRHRNYFKICAESVAELFENEILRGYQTTSWLVINDDPRIGTEELMDLVPEIIRPYVVIFSDGLNKGISQRLNEGIKAAQGDWILFLDCDDVILKNATIILHHYIRTFPLCRYISSAMIDIDEFGNILRYRRHERSSCSLFHFGMLAGHLKAIRRDLFDEIGFHDSAFSGCQDYDLALKAVSREPILLIPEYLYQYRWHEKTQSIENRHRQASVAEAVRRRFLVDFSERHFEKGDHEEIEEKVPYRGLCIIRTQGKRLHFLAEALSSIREQDPPITPCIVVHAGGDVFEEIKSWAQQICDNVIILHAKDTFKKRGYPLNVGMDYVRENSEIFGFFCFLDDDDILYPLYSKQLFQALTSMKADIAYGLANKRIPWEPPALGPQALPMSALAGGNFIPIHCYVVRTKFLMQSGVRARENMHYLEDWDFLLALLGENANFVYIPDVVCEYRIIGDGNREQKNDFTDYENCRDRVFARSEVVAKKLGIGFFLRELTKFDFSCRTLEPAEIGHMIDGRYFFELGVNRNES
jgi:glycosyltransferase involved in cell wall biosynthesis